MIPIDLSGKVALVTGASQGLGAAIAQRLHEAGAAVAINFYPDAERRNEANARKLAQSLGEERAAIFPADVRDAAAVGELFRAIASRFGAIDIVVNNAGIARDRTAIKMADEEWQAVIDTNLTGVFYVCREAARVLPEGGRIVNLSSLSAGLGLFGQSNYAAAKAGIIGLGKSLGRELGKRSITVNAVAPGLVLTELGKTVPEELRQKWLGDTPLKRFGEAADIANAVLFLSSPLASYITGQTLHVNGGMYSV